MKTERRAVHLARRKTPSGCLVDAASASDTLQPSTEHACVQRARRGIHLGRRDGPAFLNIQDIGCSELIECMLERWGPVHSLERQAYETRCTARKRPSRLGYFLGFGTVNCSRSAPKGNERQCLPSFAQCLPRVNGEISSEGTFNTPRKEFLTRQKTSHFAQQFNHFAMLGKMTSSSNSLSNR